MRRLLCLFAICAYAAASLVSDIPLFAWSGKENSFGGINVGLSSALSTKDVESLLQSVLQGTNVPNPFPHTKEHSQPEVLVIYLSSQLRLDQVSAFSAHLPALKNAMENSQSSFFAPHVDIPDSLTNTITKVTSFVSKKSGSVIYVGKGATLLPQLRQALPNIAAVSLANAKNLLDSSKIFNNGVTDIVIIHMDEVKEAVDKFSKTNAVIQSMNEMISGYTHDFIAIYTGISYDRVYSEERFVKRALQDTLVDEQYFGTNGTNGTQPSWFQSYWPGWFWEVALTFVLVIPIILGGYCMLLSVQAPEHFIPPHKDKFKKRS